MTPPPAALVRPGTVHTYEWTVPVGAGPVQGEADCLTYLYYSGVDPVKDTNSGLVGPLLVCRPGSLKRGVQVRKERQKPTSCVWTVHILLNSMFSVLICGIFAVYVGPKSGLWRYDLFCLFCLF